MFCHKRHFQPGRAALHGSRLILLLLLLPSSLVVSADYARGLDAASRGDYATAMNGLGWLYHRGHGVTTDLTRAREFYLRSADQGFAKAQSNLGSIYRRGEGVPRDYAAALGWYRLAAEQDFAPAQFFLAEMYRQGQGGAVDYQEAVSWYKRAARERSASRKNNPALKYYQGDEIISAAAAYRLGMLYYTGEGVRKDYRAAFRWHKQAAEQGNKDARKELARMYLLGRGTERDLEAAYDWWTE